MTNGTYEVFYQAAGYLSSTRVEAASKDAAAERVMSGGYKALAVTSVITVRKPA